MTTAKELRLLAQHLHKSESIDQDDIDNEPVVFRKTRRYSKAEEAMHEDDRPVVKGEERRFSSTEAPTVITTPYIYGHSVEEAPDHLHQMARLREDEAIMKPREPEEQQPHPKHERKLSFGDGGLGDHSAKLWDWPLGEHQCVQVHGNDKVFEAWLDFRPFEPNEVWAKVMCDELIIHCRSSCGRREVFRKYTLPLNCDARTTRFRIKDKNILVVSVEKTVPIKLAVANYCHCDEGQKKSDEHDKVIHAEIGKRHI